MPENINSRPEQATSVYPCPHPEWEGIWIDTTGGKNIPVDKKIPVKVLWNSNSNFWHLFSSKTGDELPYKTSNWKGPIASGWELLEPAPQSSENIRLSRKSINKCAYIKTPVDPYDLG